MEDETRRGPPLSAARGPRARNMPEPEPNGKAPAPHAHHGGEEGPGAAVAHRREDAPRLRLPLIKSPYGGGVGPRSARGRLQAARTPAGKTQGAKPRLSLDSAPWSEIGPRPPAECPSPVRERPARGAEREESWRAPDAAPRSAKRQVVLRKAKSLYSPRRPAAPDAPGAPGSCSPPRPCPRPPAHPPARPPRAPGAPRATRPPRASPARVRTPPPAQARGSGWTHGV